MLEFLFAPDIPKLAARSDITALSEALKHKRQDIRRRALDALGAIGTEAALKPIVWLVANHRSPELDEPALEILRKHETPAVAAIKDAQLDIERFDRSSIAPGDPLRATLLLARVGTPRAVNELASQADRPERDIVPRLKEIGPAEFDLLVQLLQHDGSTSRPRVIERLVERDEARAIGPLVAAYLNSSSSTMSSAVAFDAIEKLLSKWAAEIPAALLSELGELPAHRAFDVGSNRSFYVDTSAVKNAANTELRRRSVN